MKLNAGELDFISESAPNAKMEFQEETDYMEDQCVHNSELINVAFDERKSYIVVPASKLWLAIDLVARVYLPSVVKSVRNQLWPALGAVLANSFAKSLASVQKIPIPMRSRQRSKRKKSMEQEKTTKDKENTMETDIKNDEKESIDTLVDEERKQVMEQEQSIRLGQNVPEKCVDCRVLYEPVGDIVADVIFIHGLHGGLDRTWKQGTWRKTNTFKLKNKKLIKKPSENSNHFICDTEQSPRRRKTKKLDSKIPSKMAKTNKLEECKEREDKNTDKDINKNPDNNTLTNEEQNNTNNDTFIITDKIEVHGTNKNDMIKNKDVENGDSISLDRINLQLDSSINNPEKPTNSSHIETYHVQINKETMRNRSTINNSDNNLEYFSDTNSEASSNCSNDGDLEDLENFSNCWPKDWLPVDFPQCRIVTINYTTDVLWCPVWQRKRIRTNLVERSHEMTEELLRLGIGKRPIIWVGHSKGGLFIKQIILNGFESQGHNLEYYNLYEKSKAIMFYSVPHKGSSLADVTFPFFRRSIELLEIKRNCDFVLNLHKRFLDIFSEESSNLPEIFSFIDTVATKMGIMNIEMIAYESADPDVGTKCDVPLNHREICKPSGRDCLLYQELVGLIKRCLNLT